LFNIRQTIERLQQSNEKAYYLAVLRVLVSLWLIKEILFRWSTFEVLYSNHSFLQLNPTQYFSFFRLNAAFLREHYMVLVSVCMFLLVFNLLGIGRNIVSLLLFLCFTILYHFNNKFANGGDEMSMVLLFYLSFANSFSHFTLFKRKPWMLQIEKVYNLLSNLAAYSIMINLCLVYFIAGMYKLMDPYWQKGTAIYYFANYDRFSVFAASGKYVGFPLLLSYLFNYGTILLELSFPVLVWYKKYRNIVFLFILLMHLCIYFFLMIYGMTVIFIIQYGLFYSNQEVMFATGKIKLFFSKLLRLTKEKS
jgi:hypothetical protein